MLRIVERPEILPPVVVTAYKGDLIEAYFEDSGAEFIRLPGASMLESFLVAAERFQAAAYLGLSGDVLFLPEAINQSLGWYHAAECDAAVLFTKLAKPGHKKWLFKIEGDLLTDVEREEHQTLDERVCLVARNTSLEKVAARLGRPVDEDTVPPDLRSFQAGWILFLKTLVQSGGRVRACTVDVPHVNVNTPADLRVAADFVAAHELNRSR